MSKKIISMILVITLTVSLVSCTVNQHIIGKGAQSNTEINDKQWYILFGLVPLNNVDTNKMAGGASDYTIETKSSFLDAIISGITGVVTVSCRSVSVKK